MSSSVYVAGAGVISAIGTSWAETFTSFQHSRSGIGNVTLFDSVYKGVLPVGEVKLSNEELAFRVGANPSTTRTALLGMHAAKEAYLHCGIKDMKRWRVGLISATTVGGMDRTERFFPSFISNTSAGRLKDVVNHECARPTEIIADELGIKDFVTTINTACSSSVNSIILGARLIKAGKLDVVFAGGADALTKFTFNGFNSLMILDREPCRPFDATRNGLNLGEGAGFLVLVSEQVLKSENINAMAAVTGYGNTNDAFHQTASSPEGRGSYAAMQLALEAALLMPEHITYVNLHGTGTVNNDLSEGTALKRMFGEKMPKVSSTKAFTGHTLGACGGIEAVFSVMSIKYKCVFPNLRFTAPMPENGIVPHQEFDHLNVYNVMSNSFGFGGNCSSIIFSHPELA